MGEAILRIALPAVPQECYPYPPGMEITFQPRDDVLPGVSGPGLFFTNARGIRGRDFARDDAFRILAVGGSTTECLYLDETEAWPRLLEEELSGPGRKVWVGNVGRSGLNTREHIVYMERLPAQYPRLDVAVFMVGANDMLLKVLLRDDYEADFMERPGARVKAANRGFALSPESQPSDWLQGSGYGRLWWKLQHPPEAQATFVAAKLDERADCYVDLRHKRRDAAPFHDTLPDLTNGLESYRKHLERIIDLCQAQGIRPVFVTQPTMWREDLSAEEADLMWTGYIYNSTEFYSINALAEAMKRYNETLEETCASRGVDCLDLASMLPKDTTVFFDDMHFNEPGSRKVAETLAKHLRPLLP